MILINYVAINNHLKCNVPPSSTSHPLLLNQDLSTFLPLTQCVNPPFLNSLYRIFMKSISFMATPPDLVLHLPATTLVSISLIHQFMLLSAHFAFLIHQCVPEKEQGQSTAKERGARNRGICGLLKRSMLNTHQ